MIHSPLSEASLLLHHLLNQSLSSLDFCILWQELVENEPSLDEVHSLVMEFLQEADLGFLDRALALLPEPLEDTPPPLKTRTTPLQEGWRVQSTRLRETSRADFQCVECGWEITLSQEHQSNTEMRLPFDNFQCPICPAPPAELCTKVQGSEKKQTKGRA